MITVITVAQLLETQVLVTPDRPEGYMPTSPDEFREYFRPLTCGMQSEPDQETVKITFNDGSATWIQKGPEPESWRIAQTNVHEQQPPAPEDVAWASFGEQPGSEM